MPAKIYELACEIIISRLRLFIRKSSRFSLLNERDMNERARGQRTRLYTFSAFFETNRDNFSRLCTILSNSFVSRVCKFSICRDIGSHNCKVSHGYVSLTVRINHLANDHGSRRTEDIYI